MTKTEHIDYWIKSSADDWRVVQALFSTSNFVQGLFFAHLVLEKICKAHWVKSNEGNIPPRTHNLVFLILQTNLVLEDSDLQFLEEFNDFQLEGRYPDYQFQIHKRCTHAYSENLLKQVETIRLWLLERID